MMDSRQTEPDVNLLWVGFLVEGGMVVLALVLANFGIYDHRQPLAQIDSAVVWNALLWGMVATIPLFIYLILFLNWRPKFLDDLHQFTIEHLHPIFRGSTIVEMIVLALLAGFCEEILFRWCVQGGLTSILESRVGYQGAMVIGLVVASILFGLCHWVMPSYGISTMLIGIFLGATMIWSGTFLVPAIAHAIFDFVAFLYIARMDVGSTKLS